MYKCQVQCKLIPKIHTMPKALLTQVTVYSLGYDKVINYQNREKYSEEYHKHSQK